MACNAKGSVVVDPNGNIVEDTGVIDVEDTGSMEDTDPVDTDTSDTQDTQDTQDTSDTQDTDPVDTDTGPVEIPSDNNNPNIPNNFWEGTRVLNYEGCSETITEYGQEVTDTFPNWMALCPCDELYYIQTNTQSACGLPVQTAFYRGVKYNGFEIEIFAYPSNTNPNVPSAPYLLATADIMADGETWSYAYSAQGPNGAADLDGEVRFFE
jgi:hypothetical protein